MRGCLLDESVKLIHLAVWCWAMVYNLTSDDVWLKYTSHLPNQTEVGLFLLMISNVFEYLYLPKYEFKFVTL